MASFNAGGAAESVTEPKATPAAAETVGRAANGADVEVTDRAIGRILSDLRNLSAEQVDAALRHQNQHGVRFGEAAVALGYVTERDVLFALSQQFHYPYLPEEQREFGDELVMLKEPFSPRAEVFRDIRSQLIARVFSEQGTGPGRAVAIVSPETGDGKTYCAANLAVALAQLGGRTLLIDADMRQPRVHTLFGLDDGAGLSGILAGRSESRVLKQVDRVPSLFVLPVGVTPPNPLELLERPAFALLMRELISKFDHVFVDTPAASLGSDSSVIAARCGAALIVARKNTGRVRNMQKLTANIAGSTGVLAGVVLNEF